MLRRLLDSLQHSFNRLGHLLLGDRLHDEFDAHLFRLLRSHHFPISLAKDEDPHDWPFSPLKRGEMIFILPLSGFTVAGLNAVRHAWQTGLLPNYRGCCVTLLMIRYASLNKPGDALSYSVESVISLRNFGYIVSHIIKDLGWAFGRIFLVGHSRSGCSCRPAVKNDGHGEWNGHGFGRCHGTFTVYVSSQVYLVESFFWGYRSTGIYTGCGHLPDNNIGEEVADNGLNSFNCGTH